jgi:hypothetical protein
MPELCSPQQVYADLQDRKKDRQRYEAIHGIVRRIMEGDASVFREVTVPSEHDLPAEHHMLVANIMLNAQEQLSRRVAVAPTITDLPTHPDAEIAHKRAATNTKAKRAWMAENTGGLVGYQISRYLLSYAEAPIVIRPNTKRMIPRFEERDPLTAYPSDDTDWRPTVDDIVFSFTKPVSTLMARYPAIGFPDDVKTTKWECVEHFCPSCYLLFATSTTPMGARRFVTLAHEPNSTSATMAVVPRLICSGGRAGAFNQMVGLMSAQARLTTLSLVAAERGVFPETVWSGEIIGTINEGPDGNTLMGPDGRVQRMTYNSSYQFPQEIDRLERSLRLAGDYPAQLSGETPSALATGRGNQLLLAATVDEGIKERQQILGEGWREAIERGVTLSKTYWGEQRIPITTTDNGLSRTITYTPSKMTEGTTRVEYGLLSSADVNSATVVLGQMASLGMSRRDVFGLHPYVEDAQTAEENTIKQRLDDALLAGVSEKIATGQLDPLAVARMKKAITDGKSVEDAYEEAIASIKQAQEAQDEALLPEAADPAAAAAGAATLFPGQPAVPQPRQVAQSFFGDI